MQKIYTAGGEAFDADACGVSWLGQLYISVAGQDFAGLLPVFSDPAQTRELTWADGGQSVTYAGYTELQSLQKDKRGHRIQLCLARPQKEDI